MAINDNAVYFAEYGTIFYAEPGTALPANGLKGHQLYQTMGSVFKPTDHVGYYIISSMEEFEKAYGRQADKKRKLYNGMLKCNLYQYFSTKK